MTQIQAAHLLRDYLFEAYPSRVTGEPILYFRRPDGALALACNVPPAEVQSARDSLIGKDFRFYWPPLT